MARGAPSGGWRVPLVGRLAGLVALVGVLIVVASWIVGGQLIRTHPREVGPPPADLAATPVELPGAWGRLSGWRLGAVQGRSCVLLLHGIGADRRAMISRARMLDEAGYGVLLLDQQGHGESEGSAVAFGARSRFDAVTGVAALRGWGCARVGVIGVSMGGAAALLAEDELGADAIVAEQVYATLEEAADARLSQQLGWAGPVVRRLLMVQLGPRLGLGAAEVRPVASMPAVQAPVLLVAGELDWRAPPEAAERMVEAGDDVELWVVPDAGHEDLHHRLGQDYEVRVLRFLARYLAPRS